MQTHGAESTYFVRRVAVAQQGPESLILTWEQLGYGNHVLYMSASDGTERKRAFTTQASLLAYVRRIADRRVRWCPPLRKQRPAPVSDAQLTIDQLLKG